MEKFKKSIEKELKEIEQQGLNMNNIEVASKLVEMLKNLSKIEKSEEGDEKGMRKYREYDDYRGDYERRYRDDDDYSYGRRSRDSRGRFRDSGYREGGYREGGGGGYQDGGYGHGNKFYEMLDRLEECVEEYEYGRSRYREGGNEERMHEGLEKLMYSICMFIESAMNFAETPEEKEIIRKHVKKLQSI